MFRRITDKIAVSPQIGQADVALAAQAGFAMIVNNRPDDEDAGQPAGETIAAAAAAAGLDYVAIPVTHAGFGAWQVQAMADAVARAPGPVLAYCRSGTRSTLLWALAQASLGEAPDTLAVAAAAAGYDLSPIRAALDMLAARAGAVDPPTP